MFGQTPSEQYYRFFISNLIAAFGGGLILGKGAGIIDYPYLQGGSILAFFLGTILGLLFLHAIPNSRSQLISNFFSICCGVTSLILLYMNHKYADQGVLVETPALIFFLLLSIRFGFWFYSRVMRASKASSDQYSVAWVELGYYLGMVLGLVIWKLVGIEIGLSTALIIDAFFQFLAGILDVMNIRRNTSSVPQSTQNPFKNLDSDLSVAHLTWCWKLSGAVVLCTLGIQVIIFSAAHDVADIFGTYMLATFYLGVATAAFVCKKYQLYMLWDHRANHMAFIATQYNGKQHRLPLFNLILMGFIAVMVVTFEINTHASHSRIPFLSELFICSFIFLSAFIYEILSLSFLDRIGYEERLLGHSGVIMRTYGLMGLSAAIGFWGLGLSQHHLTHYIMTLTICLAISSLMLSKRKSNKWCSQEQLTQ
jgi:hypothetical protein